MDGADETVKMEDQDKLVAEALKHFFPGLEDLPTNWKAVIARVYKEYKIQRNYVEYMSQRANGAEAERVKIAKELQEAKSENRRLQEKLEEFETELEHRKRGIDMLKARLEQMTLDAERKEKQTANVYRITPPAGMQIVSVYFGKTEEEEE